MKVVALIHLFCASLFLAVAFSIHFETGLIKKEDAKSMKQGFPFFDSKKISLLYLIIACGLFVYYMISKVIPAFR